MMNGRNQTLTLSTVILIARGVSASTVYPKNTQKFTREFD